VVGVVGPADAVLAAVVADGIRGDDESENE
jgi:hypothetical protein